MSGLAILLTVLAALVWALAARRLWRAARRAGERDTVVYLCILAWPVVACWVLCQLVAEALRLIRSSARRLP